MRSLVFLYVAVALGAFVCSTAAGAQDVHDFHFSSFEADYYLSKDGEGRAHLRVVERLTAEFPDRNQNKGLARAIPAVFEGHPVSFELESVTRNGEQEPIYDRYRLRNNEVVETGTDYYVRGTQVYEFTYTMRDVIRDANGAQEFYWDTNGTEWRQAFDGLTARVHLDESVRDLFTGETRCYQGPPGSTRQCGGITEDDYTFTFVSDGRIPAGHTVSMVLNFEPDAFQPYSEGAAGGLRTLGALGAVGMSLAGVAYVLRARFTRGRDARSTARVTPQFSPPADMSLALADGIYHRTGSLKLAPALIVDLAIRGNVRIIETEFKGLFGTSKDYSAELLSTEGLRDDEQEFVRALFGSETPGTVHIFKSNDSVLTARLDAFQQEVKESILAAGYRDKITVGWTPYILTLAAAVLGGAVVATAPLSGFEEWRAVGLLAAGASFVFVVFGSLGIRPLTEEGRPLYDYLAGLKMYIKADEARRLRALQSPDTADTTPVDVNDAAQVVDLHEKLLPYAILFGLDKGWLKQLNLDYGKTSQEPHWYRGTGPFSASSFSSSIGGMVSSVSHVSAPSSGGGGAGGGGGGGGGGGR